MCFSISSQTFDRTILTYGQTERHRDTTRMSVLLNWRTWMCTCTCVCVWAGVHVYKYIHIPDGRIIVPFSFFKKKHRNSILHLAVLWTIARQAFNCFSLSYSRIFCLVRFLNLEKDDNISTRWEWRRRWTSLAVIVELRVHFLSFSYAFAFFRSFPIRFR